MKLYLTLRVQQSISYLLLLPLESGVQFPCERVSLILAKFILSLMKLLYPIPLATTTYETTLLQVWSIPRLSQLTLPTQYSMCYFLRIPIPIAKVLYYKSTNSILKVFVRNVPLCKGISGLTSNQLTQGLLLTRTSCKLTTDLLITTNFL